MSGKRSRRKGCRLEQEVAQRFREAGFADAITARAGDRSKDAKGQDILNCGQWFPQCKSVERLGLIHHVLDEMEPGPEEVPIVFHKAARKGTIVAMREADFFRLVSLKSKDDS